MSKGKGQQVMEDNSFPLEFQLLDRKDILKGVITYEFNQMTSDSWQLVFSVSVGGV